MISWNAVATKWGILIVTEDINQPLSLSCWCHIHQCLIAYNASLSQQQITPLHLRWERSICGSCTGINMTMVFAVTPCCDIAHLCLINWSTSNSMVIVWTRQDVLSTYLAWLRRLTEGKLMVYNMNTRVHFSGACMCLCVFNVSGGD